MGQEQDTSHSPDPNRRKSPQHPTPEIIPLQGADYENFLKQGVYPLLTFLAANSLADNDIFEIEVPPYPEERVFIYHRDEESKTATKTALPFSELRIPKDSFPHAALQSLSHLALDHPEERFQAIWQKEQPKVGITRFVTPLLIDFNPGQMADRTFLPDFVHDLRLQRSLRIGNAEHLQKRYLSEAPWSGEATSHFRLRSIAEFRTFELLVEELLNASNACHILKRPPQFVFGRRQCRIDIDTESDGTVYSSQEFQRLALAWDILDSTEHPNQSPMLTAEELKRPRTITLRMPKRRGRE